ncbi:DsrE family protein [Sulfuracidifex metallicus]|uniref:Uncharacterized protein n=1 Tax=Sulfuracidifex metallicus DSM 6482 = JCM 9184 TaxID=523847 RepID=A0A6A9QIP1_SULME|nr:DsrE family protein [Sulfuracidifex metallicus]MUN29147.1 hypothetical protein [Sulfuracidifex metallicus DSM 6482 = JCM 9184]WOE50331.1 DsrE family protein [Sulfuracidifex metallicus DSM 6482 = JCM 9184]
MNDKVLFVFMTGRENMAKLLANVGMASKIKEADPDIYIEMIFLTPAVEALNKKQVMFKPILEAIKEARKRGVKVIACEVAMKNVGLDKEDIEDGLVDEFAPVGGIYVLNRIKEGYETLTI